MTGPVIADLTVGQELARREVTVDRARLVRYAGASGDFNPIHWNDRVATAVGLPGVIAHGMWTMGAASSVVADWIGDPGAVLDYQVRFTRPVPVPDPGAATIEVTAVVVAQRAEAQLFEDPAAGIDFSRVVHADERFTHHRPIHAGDRLVTVLHVDSITVRAGLAMITTRAEIASEGGEPVATVVSTLAVRPEES